MHKPNSLSFKSKKQEEEVTFKINFGYNVFPSYKDEYSVFILESPFPKIIISPSSNIYADSICILWYWNFIFLVFDIKK